MSTPAFFDTALAYDPVTQRADLAFDGRHLMIGTTVLTPLLLSIGLDRRAHPDDVLPDDNTSGLAPKRLDQRRGWAGDMLDPLGRRTGSRWWLLGNRKQTEATRKFAEGVLVEALAPFDAMGLAVTIAVRWLRANVLGYSVKIGDVASPQFQVGL